MDLILFVLLVTWFLTGRALSDLQTLGRKALAWTADKVADLAERHAGRAPKFAPFVAQLARSGAHKLRDRPSPTDPRTSDGQAVFDGASAVAAAGVALLLLWVRVAVADAVGAARSSAHPRATTSDTRWAWLAGWLAWARWPKPGEPHAPVYANATRTDRPEPLALPAAASAAGTTSNTGFTTQWKTRKTK